MKIFINSLISTESLVIRFTNTFRFLKASWSNKKSFRKFSAGYKSYLIRNKRTLLENALTNWILKLRNCGLYLQHSMLLSVVVVIILLVAFNYTRWPNYTRWSMFADRRNAWKERKYECSGRGVRGFSFWKRKESNELKKQSRFELWERVD